MKTNFPFALTNTNDDKQLSSLKICVYGQSGVGKTTLAKTAENCIIVNFENGLACLAGENINIYTPNTVDEFAEFIKYMVANQNNYPYETVIIDSITALAERLLLKHKKDLKDGRQAYMLVQEQIYALTQELVSLNKINVVFICQEAKVVDGLNNKILRGPDFPGQKVSAKFPYFMDCVLHLKSELVKNEDGNYDKVVYFVTTPTADEEGKDRTGKLDMYEEPDLSKIFNKIRGVK